ncbi:MAG: sulfatase [Planctomycetes bacterium]|nr:sulfatase [Planctomycetota bacterium]
MPRLPQLFALTLAAALSSCSDDGSAGAGRMEVLALRADSSSGASTAVEVVEMFKPSEEAVREWTFDHCVPSFARTRKHGDTIALTSERRTYTVGIPCDIQPGTVNQIVLNLTTSQVTTVRARFRSKGKILCLSEAIRQPVTREPETVFLDISKALSLDQPCDEVEIIFTITQEKKPSLLFGVDLMWVPPASVLPMAGVTSSTGGPIELSGDFRSGLCLGNGVAARTEAEVFKDAELRFSFGIPRQALFAGSGGSLEVSISAQGAEPKRETIPLESLTTWTDVRMALGEFEGKAADIELLFKGDGPSEALLALEAPRLVSPESDPKHVVLITSDTHRGDHLGQAGTGVEIKTPFLDELAQTGVFFEDCMSTTNITVPSHVAMMTGHSPKAVGLIDNMTALSPSSVTLAEYFREEGYYTVSVLSTKHLRHDNSGLGQGFARIIATDREKQLGHVSTELIAEVLEAEGDQPCFIWLHLFDAHAPYSPPEEYKYEYYPEDKNPYTEGTGLNDGTRAVWDPRIRDLEFVLAQYRSEITYLDDTIEAVFGESAFDDAIIAFTADHGEVLGKHGIYFKHTGLYTDTVHIPLIMRWPGCPAGMRVKAPVQNVNLGRTLLDLAGLGDKEFPGVSLLESFDEEGASAPRFALGAHGHCAAVEKDGWLCVLTLQSKGVPNARKHKVELFNIKEDPGCLVDLVDEEFERAKLLRRGLIEWLSSDRLEGMAVSRTQHSAELMEAIAALGYATESGSTDGPYYEEDPKDEWCERFQ